MILKPTLSVVCFVALLQLLEAEKTDGFLSCILRRSSRNYTDPAMVYDRINERLEKHLKKDTDARKNIKAAIKWLEKEINPVCPDHSSPIPFEQALDRLEALFRFQNYSSCDLGSYKVLDSNDKATRGQARQSGIQSQRRIDQVVRFYFERHALFCRDVYPEKLKLYLGEMDKDTLAKVQMFANGVIKGNKDRIEFGRSNKKTIWINWTPILNQPLRDEFVDSKTLFAATKIESLDFLKNTTEMFKHLSKGDPNRKYLSRNPDSFSILITHSTRRNVDGIFKTHLIEPCKLYLEKLSDIFLPAIFDERTLNEVSSMELEESKDILKRVDFYINRATFKICDILINSINRKLLDYQLEEMSNLNKH